MFFLFTLLVWLFIPFSFKGVLLNNAYSFIFIFVFNSLNGYFLIFAGWISRSKYSIFGSIRALAQVLSYEVSFVLTLLPIFLYSNSLSLVILNKKHFFSCYWLIFLPILILFFISFLAETNRVPYDMTEAESELVSGYCIEYSSFVFSCFMLGEYGSILSGSVIISILFFNFNFFCILPFFLVFFCILVILVRATFPRQRYDRLMFFCWNIILPLSISLLFFYTGVYILFVCF